MDKISLKSYSTLVLPQTNMDFNDMDDTYVKMLAHGLSALTICSCLFLKVPQIMHVRRKRSAEGIYIQAMLMEIIGFTIVTLYNYRNGYSLMTYLEYPIILLQIFVLLFYVLRYKGLLDFFLVPLFAGMYTAVVLGFVTKTLSKDPLTYVLPLCTPLSGFAKVTYMYGIMRSRNADAVSLTTWIISISTNLVRIFTVYMDSGDVTLMANFTVSSLLSLGVLLTAVYYQRMACPPPPPAQRRRSSRRDE